MKKIKIGFCLPGCLFLIFSAASAEEVKVVTYYPAPYSEYKEMNTTQNTNLATNNIAPNDGVATYKVGIGTTAPTQKLDVAGSVKFSGTLMPGNSAGTTGQVLTSQGNEASPIWSNSGKSATVYLQTPISLGFSTVSPIPSGVSFISGEISGYPFSVAGLKASNPTSLIATETRHIIGLLVEYRLMFASTKAANGNLTYRIWAHREGILNGGSGCDTMDAYGQMPPVTNSTTTATSGDFYGAYNIIDKNNDGNFGCLGVWSFSRVNNTNFTADTGWVSMSYIVTGYMTSE